MSLARAIETGDVGLLPSRRDEDWRWSDLRGLVRTAPPPSAPFEGRLPAGPFGGPAVDEVAIVNGRGPASITVAAGASRRLALRLVSAPGSGAHVARLFIEVAAGARLVLLESYEGPGEDYLADAELDIAIGEGARLERVVLAGDAADAVSVSIARISLAPGGRLAQTVLTSGARRQRLETRVRHAGHEASVRIDGLYDLDGRRHADITTIVDHLAAGGTTDQLVKGVVNEQARGIFQGRVIVRPGADRTDARMGHHALMLSDRAEVDAKPELEIWADDVACAHGNTVGALDEEALFYAMQRGVPEAEARALLTSAFLGEVVERIEDEVAAAAARAWLSKVTRWAP